MATNLVWAIAFIAYLRYIIPYKYDQRHTAGPARASAQPPPFFLLRAAAPPRRSGFPCSHGPLPCPARVLFSAGLAVRPAHLATAPAPSRVPAGAEGACLAALTASGAPPTAGTGGRGSRPIREPRRPKANSIFPPAPAYSRVEDHLWPHPDPANGLLPGGHREHPSAG